MHIIFGGTLANTRFPHWNIVRWNVGLIFHNQNPYDMVGYFREFPLFRLLGSDPIAMNHKTDPHAIQLKLYPWYLY